jgi:exosortase
MPAAAVTYSQTWVEIWRYWEGETGLYLHGILVAIAAVWLLWRAMSAVETIETTPSTLAVPVVLLLSTSWVLAEKANVFIVYVALWPILAFAVLWVGLGLRAASEFSSPLGFLYFAIPVWDFLQPPLQAITSTMVGIFMYIFGMPAVLDGPYITLPTARLFIAEDCSGAYFLCVALAVGVLAGITRCDAPRTRLLLLVIAGSLSMAFNWIRILLIALAYLHPGLNKAMDWMGGHELLGWSVFAIGLFVFGQVLRFIPRTPYPHPETQRPAQSVSSRPKNYAGLWMSVFALVLLPVITWALPRFDAYPAGLPRTGLALLRAKADLVPPDLRWSPHFPGAVWEDRLALMKDGGIMLEVYGNRYHEQTQGSELISSVSNLFDPASFALGSSEIVELVGSKGQPMHARLGLLSHNSGSSWLTMYTYFVDSDPVTSIRRVQLITGLRSMHSRSTAGIIAVAMPCIEVCESHISDLEDTFIRAFEDYRDTFSE